jgi:hypothetical protein
MAFDAYCSCSAVGHVLPLVRGAPASRGLASASRRSLFSAVAWAGRPSRHPGRVCSPDPFDPLRPEPLSSQYRAPTHWKRRRSNRRSQSPLVHLLLGPSRLRVKNLNGSAIWHKGGVWVLLVVPLGAGSARWGFYANKKAPRFAGLGFIGEGFVGRLRPACSCGGASPPRRG